MAYHDLSECTLNPDERRAEADKLLEIIALTSTTLSIKENEFIMNIDTGPVSVKQLFWLRDIKDKQL